MLEIVGQEKRFDLLEVVFEVIELLVVVFLDRADLFADVSELSYLILDLVLEEADLVLEVINAELI